MPPNGDIIDILYQDDRFTKLVELLKQSGDLVDELQRADGLTFFAPTNQVSQNMKYMVLTIDCFVDIGRFLKSTWK